MNSCLKKYKALVFFTVLLAAISSSSLVFLSVFMQKAIDFAIAKDFTNFKLTILHTIIYVIIVAMLFYTYNILNKKLNIKVIKRYRNSIFQGILNLTYSDFTSKNTADYISHLTNDIKLIEDNYLQPLLFCLQNIIIFILTATLIFLYSPVITLILFVCMFFMFSSPIIFSKRLNLRQTTYSNMLATFTSKLKDTFSGFEVIKCFNIINSTHEDFKSINTTLSDTKYAVDLLLVKSETFAQMLSFTAQMSAIFTCAYLVLKGNLTAGTVVAIIQLSGSLLSPITVLMNNIPKINSMKSVIKKLDELAQTPIQSSDSSITFNESIVCNDLTFAYDSKNVLDHLNLTISKNKKYALIGESGCGKSTLIKLLLGYYTNYQGSIKFDNQPIDKVSIEHLSHLASLIHQNVYMFDTTIKDNITLYHEFTDEQLNDALKLSGVDKFYTLNNTATVGENGCHLSGGQKQRIAIARALICKTPLLILDEGTSAIDHQTAWDIETQLLAIDTLTLLTITHNLSSDLLSLYDEIIFIQDGIIAEHGHFSQLLQNKSHFYNFYTLQDNI